MIYNKGKAHWENEKQFQRSCLYLLNQISFKNKHILKTFSLIRFCKDFQLIELLVVNRFQITTFENYFIT